MTRVSILPFVSLLMLAASPESAHGAPGVAKAAPTAPAKKSRPKAKAKARPSSKANAEPKPKAKGPGVSLRKGVVRVGVAPKNVKLEPFPEGAQIRSGSDGKLVKAAHRERFTLAKSAVLTPDNPKKGGMFLRAFLATWDAGPTFPGEKPNIRATGDGGISIRMPLTSDVANKDLKVECKGVFPDEMTVRGGVNSSTASYVTNTAVFSSVSDTLKFLIEVPTTDRPNPRFVVAMSSNHASEWFKITSCSVEQV